MRRPAQILMLGILCILTSGCSSFHQKWKTALHQPIPSSGLAGPWEGHWVSDKNGHTGRLRCVMTQTGANSYDAHFHAVFWKILRAAYEVPFDSAETAEPYHFSGQSDLGKLAGGVYSYDGIAVAGDFNATYHSKYDHGRFVMRRPEPK